MKRAQRKYVVKCITYMALLLLHTGSAEVQTKYFLLGCIPWILLLFFYYYNNTRNY
jgi:hypothetical protein